MAYLDLQKAPALFGAALTDLSPLAARERAVLHLARRDPVGSLSPASAVERLAARLFGLRRQMNALTRGLARLAEIGAAWLDAGPTGVAVLLIRPVLHRLVGSA